MRRMLRNISLATRLALVALIVTLVSLTVTAAVGLVRGSDLADEVVDDRLVALTASEANNLELFINSVRLEIGALASSPAIAQDIRELTAATTELSEQPVRSSTGEAVTDHYLSTVRPELEQVRGESGSKVASLVPTGSAALSLQAAYTVPTETESGATLSPELVVDGGDGSTYSEVHARIHRTYSSIAVQSGLDDLYLIEPDASLVVYSYRKRIDFATSLDLGPHSGSGLARSVDLVSLDIDQPPYLSGFSRYVPAIEQPTAFVVTAVVDGDELVGYLAYAISHTRLDDIIAGADRWAAYGASGDAYIANADATMITTARSFEEDPVGFFEASKEPGPGLLTDAQRQRLVQTDTTALVQGVSSDLVLAAQEAPGIVDTTNYRGTAVRTVYVALEIPGVTWTLFVEAQTEELDTTIEDYARDMLIAIALFVVAITFIVVRWSTRLVAPIRQIANRLRRARSVADAGPDPLAMGGVPDVAQPVDVSDELEDTGPGATEFIDLADNVDEMLERLRERRAAVAERSRERTSLLRQFLPAAIARRSEETNSEVLDHVRQATVAVIQVDGLGDMIGGTPEQEVRDLLAELVDEVDGEAAEAGVERVKLSGSTYYAVCGASRPLLDHAPRTVAFALRVRELVADSTDGRLSARIGVAEGPVSVGLAERAALVYDAWGDTVTLAEELSHAAPTEGVLVSDLVTAHLPDDFVTAGDVGEGRTVVTGRISQGAAT